MSMESDLQESLERRKCLVIVNGPLLEELRLRARKEAQDADLYYQPGQASGVRGDAGTDRPVPDDLGPED